MRHILILLLSFIFALPVLAQNVRRLEEEQELDKVRRQRVEDIIRQRQEEEEKLRQQPITIEDQERQNLVEVEPSNILPSDLSSIYALVPYSVRRSRWGLEVGVALSQFEPSSYESSYANPTLVNFSDLYSTAQMPLTELYFNFKYNFILGSVGAEVAYGMYNNDSEDDSFGDLSLNLQVIRAGAKYIMDNLFFEPFVAPYVLGGAYTVIYKETAASNSRGGNTQPAPYIGAGVLFQLNWVDRAAAVESYAEAGIENTYLFAEVRQYMASSDPKDPDFSTDPTISAGLSLEF